jgi:predicted ester cyclase
VVTAFSLRRERYFSADKKKQVSYDFCAVQAAQGGIPMSAVTLDNKALITEYFHALSGQPKTEELISRYISDPSLKEHIRQAEAAFPGYEVIAHQIVAEDDKVAARCTVRGVHKGEFAGIPATGREITSDFMIFYRLAEGMIAEHWMQLNVADILQQLTA